MPVDLKFQRIKETCIYSGDLGRMREFYHNVLGMPVISEVEGKHIFFRVGDSVLLCFNPKDSRTKTHPPAHYGDGKPHFALEVTASDYENMKQALITRGIDITDEVTWDNNQQSFYFEDPAGNVLEVVPQGIWD